MAAGGIHDQLGGGFSRYSVDAPGRCRTSRRCSTTTRCSRAPTCTAGRRAASARLLDVCLRHARAGRCARCAAPRAASTRRSTPTPRASRAASTCGRSPSCASCSARTRGAAIAWLGATEQGNFEDPHHPQPGLERAAGPRHERSPPSSTRDARAHPRAAARRARRARAPGARRQAPDVAGTR